jgi:hypothetical protein
LPHEVPHAPQLSTLVCRLVSQPLTGLPSQLAQPASQVGTQTPLLHTVVPCALLHTVPQAPQFCVVASAASQPFA